LCPHSTVFNFDLEQMKLESALFDMCSDGIELFGNGLSAFPAVWIWATQQPDLQMAKRQRTARGHLHEQRSGHILSYALRFYALENILRQGGAVFERRQRRKVHYLKLKIEPVTWGLRLF